MAENRDFQVFVKPAGAACNLACRYCYYMRKTKAAPQGMPREILERYISQHIDVCTDKIVRFSWHGGEPTLLGPDYFLKIVEMQRRHRPPGTQIANAMITNGTLLDEQWCRFLAEQGFSVGLSLDGPENLHNCCRVDKAGKPSFERVMRGYELLRQHGIACDILCVVNAHNVERPLDVYRFFKKIKAPYVSFLPLVDRRRVGNPAVTELSVAADKWGDFLCTIFDEWLQQDIGTIKVQIFEEAARTAFGQEHSLCIFRPTCGNIPVVEHSGDFFPCDHFVDAEHRIGNIMDTPLAELLDAPAQRAFGQAKLGTLPRDCLECKFRPMCNGECPKNRFLKTADGGRGLNYLCAGYKKFFTHCTPWVDAVGAVALPEKPDNSGRQNEMIVRF